MIRRVLICVLTGIFLLSACASGEGIEAHEAWVRTAVKGENGAVYLILHNHTPTDDSLIDISANVATTVELHLTEVDTNSVMRMSPLGEIEIIAGSEVEFKSGSYHIMLVGLKQDLNVGDEIIITFDFQNYQDVTLTVLVMDSAEMVEHQHP